MKSFSSLTEIRTQLSNDEISCLSLVNHYLKKIENSKTNSFIEVYKEDAINKAKEIDLKIQHSKHGKLAGLIVGIKDNISVENKPLTASSKILKNFNSIYNSTAVERLINEDAIVIGRLNCDEFAMGSSNENSCYGPTLNPIDLDKVPGGSSGGSAAAVAEDLCLAALG